MANDSQAALMMEIRKAYFDLLNLKSGVRFCPSDKELVGRFLLGKIRRGEAADADDPIKELDAYSVEPWDLWKTHADAEASDVYFYTKLKRKTGKKNIERGVRGGKGRWHGGTSASEIGIRVKKKNKQKERLFKFETRVFNYWNDGHVEDRQWLMTEYRVKEEKGSAAVDLVIFRLRKNSDKGKGRDRNDVVCLPSSYPTTGDSTCTDEDGDDNSSKRSKIVVAADETGDFDDIWVGLGDLSVDMPNDLMF